MRCKLGKSSHFEFKLLLFTKTFNKRNQRKCEPMLNSKEKKAKLKHHYKIDTTAFSNCFFATEQFTLKINS